MITIIIIAGLAIAALVYIISQHSKTNSSSQKKENTLKIDLREVDAVKISKAGYINIRYSNLQRVKALSDDKTSFILLYHDSEAKSYQAKKKLESWGYTNVHIAP